MIGRVFRGVITATLMCTAGMVAPAGAVTIATTHVGDAGNPSDSTGYGAVPYGFDIGKSEITNNQYAEFLNAVDPTFQNSLGLWTLPMMTQPQGGIMASSITGYSAKPGRGNQPAILISWLSAIRFANWLHNGQQGPGTTEYGSYILEGGTKYPTNLNHIVRSAGATWVLPTENEWYKAAYYQPAIAGGDSDGYWLYPTTSNDAPYSDRPPGLQTPDPTNAGNFHRDDNTANGFNDGYALSGSNLIDNAFDYLSNVGAYTFASSYFGTFDQGGNVTEWNEDSSPLGPYTEHPVRGGTWATGENQMRATTRFTASPDLGDFVGFRVALVPEPSVGANLIWLGIAALVGRLRQRRN